MIHDSTLTCRIKTKRRSEVAHDKAAIIISYTGKCKTCSGHLTKRYYKIIIFTECVQRTAVVMIAMGDPINKKIWLLIKVGLQTSLIE